ncbi:MAG: alkaline phosphatase [Alphaproteobacteria bacterium]|nr:alkaline phosphatase [Alphaproteobacteria bacterium]
MITRRQFVAGAAAATVAAPALLSAQSGGYTAFPFGLGVAAGDPAPDGFVIWTRVAPEPLEPHGGMAMAPVPVRWEVATDQLFAAIVARGEEIARPELAHSVHVELAGLLPDRPYWYRFRAGGEKSVVGRARTLPAAATSPRALRFGVAGCQNYEDGFYAAYRHLADEDLAFVYHYGDYIYEGWPSGIHTSHSGEITAPVRRHAGQNCYDLADYRRRYAQYKTDPDLQRAHTAHAWFATFDDHEVRDNWAGDSDTTDTPPELFRTRRAAAFQAWYEHMPVRRALLPEGAAIRAWRGARYGDLVSFDFLDTRQYRTGHPCGDDFSPPCPTLADPRAAVMSAEEEAWLVRNLSRPQARWSCVAQQVMMMSLDRRTEDGPAPILNMDSWAGYEAPRRRLLARMRGLDNVVVLTGDEHQNFAGILTDGDQPVAVEFVATSISSGGDGSDLRRGSDRILAGNPQLKFINDQRGYLICEVTPDDWRSNFMVLDRVSTPGGNLRRRAAISVVRGRPALAIA